MKLITLSLTLIIALNSCTWSVNMVHTEGTASDVVDETDSNTPTVTTNVSPTVPRVL